MGLKRQNEGRTKRKYTTLIMYTNTHELTNCSNSPMSVTSNSCRTAVDSQLENNYDLSLSKCENLEVYCECVISATV